MADDGRPPLARGKVSPTPHPRTHRRETPARAGKGFWMAPARSFQSGDPRSRGERGVLRRVDNELVGRPPLARGKVRESVKAAKGGRETPARAGKGQKSLPAMQVSCGRPPLARGKGQLCKSETFGERETPARAGKGPRPRGSPGLPSGDPRSRGERLSTTLTLAQVVGRPPLARGKGGLRRRRARRRRETPARAGKGPLMNVWSGLIAGDPRSRGERVEAWRVNAPSGGRPPLARGKAYRSPGYRSVSRETPARAGKGLDKKAPYLQTPGDPRSRGERRLGNRRLRRGRGRPPLARGKEHGGVAGRLALRETPARAGKGPPCRRPISLTPGDPRSRGERAFSRLDSDNNPGRPPLARGKVATQRRPMGHERETPARAGKGDAAPSPLAPASGDPRSRGERSARQVSTLAGSGRPPLARGKVLQGPP